MNLRALCRTIGDLLYEKGMIGNVTIDLVSFPNPTDPKAHPLFWAVDLSNELSDNAAICYFFDILMEGELNQETGEYNIDVFKEPDNYNLGEDLNKESIIYKQPRSFMYCSFLHHPGLAQIQYKTFFHMCRIESISFDMEKKSGSTFCLYDSLQSGVLGMLTIGISRNSAIH